MNITLPPFQPPTRPTQVQPTFPEYLRQLEQWLDKYTKYMLDYQAQLVSVVNTGTQGFGLTTLAVDTDIFITAFITLLSGTGTISNIYTTPGFSGSIVLVAVDGFSTDTSGNISLSTAIVAGQAGIFTFDPVTEKWYANVGVGGSSGGGSVLAAGTVNATASTTDIVVTFGAAVALPYVPVVSLISDVGTTVRVVPGTETTTGFTARLGVTPTVSDTITLAYVVVTPV